MAAKKRYPKSFYDDGLGDFLEWIDDEVLIHSEGKISNRGTNAARNQDSKTTSDKRAHKNKVKVSLYGDNDVSEPKYKAAKKIKFELGDDDFNEKVDKNVSDTVRGLVNRLAAQTMPYVTSEFEKLYSTNSRSTINASLFSNIESSVITSHALAKKKIVAELMILVSFLSTKISEDIGASLVHRLISKLESLYTKDEDGDDRKIENIVLCLANLYLTGLISANVLFEVAKRICSSHFRAKSLDILLVILRNIGFQLRKDNPTSMRQLILMAQECAKAIKSTNSLTKTKIDFMMDALSAIKNNNMSKITNYGMDVDKETVESSLKALLRRTKVPNCLSDATYEEMVSSSNFYLLETRIDENESPSSKRDQNKKDICSKTDIKICKALGLNKPAERTIFSALLRVSDHIEASNVIIGFGMNHCSDAMLVSIHVAIYEKKYNPFYYNLINNLCKFNRKYKMAAKFAIQDKIRVLGQMAPERANIFKVLCFELVKSDAVPITILKAVEWADLSQSTKIFLVHLFESISQLPDEEKRRIMSKVERRSSFAGAMRTFVNCFIKGCNLFDSS